MGTPKLSSPLTLEDRTLWFGKIELCEERVVISGWTWSGPVEEEILIADVTTFDKWTTLKGPNFRLTRDGKPSVYGRIERGMAFWASALTDDDRVEVERRH